jgi:hypothetical protein
MDPELERCFEVVSGYFGLLAEPTRLKILNAICDGELSVTEIVERVESTQTNVFAPPEFDVRQGRVEAPARGCVDVLLNRRSEPSVTLCRTACVQMASQFDERSVSNRTLKRFMQRA